MIAHSIVHERHPTSQAGSFNNRGFINRLTHPRSANVLVAKRRYVHMIFLVASAGGLVGCGPAAEPRFDPTAIERRVTALEASIKIDEAALWKMRFARNDTASIPPTEKSFAFLDSDVGPLAISIQKVEALADGSQITVNFGNTSGASIGALKYHVSWGPATKEGYLDTASSRESERDIDQPLYSGSWNTVKIPLAGIPPSKLGMVEFSKPQIVRITLTPR